MLHAMIGETSLRWAVTLLFSISLAMYAYLVVAHRDRWSGRLTHLLHLTMSVAMVLMVWRVGLDLPAIGPTLFSRGRRLVRGRCRLGIVGIPSATEDLLLRGD